MATCIKCCAEFSQAGRRRGGKMTKYKDMCLKCRQPAYQKDYEDRKRAEGTFYSMRRDNKVKREYGITRQQYEQLFHNQNGVCAICQDSLVNTKQVHVDHCHETHNVRGILCFRCNVGLGSFQDSAAVLRNAIDYLARPAAFTNISVQSATILARRAAQSAIDRGVHCEGAPRPAQIGAAA